MNILYIHKKHLGNEDLRACPWNWETKGNLLYLILYVGLMTTEFTPRSVGSYLSLLFPKSFCVFLCPFNSHTYSQNSRRYFLLDSHHYGLSLYRIHYQYTRDPQLVCCVPRIFEFLHCICYVTFRELTIVRCEWLIKSQILAGSCECHPNGGPQAFTTWLSSWKSSP